MELSTRVPHGTGYVVVWETIDGSVTVEERHAGTVKPDPEPPDGRYGWIVCDIDGVLVQKVSSLGVALASVAEQFRLTIRGQKRLAEIQREREPSRFCKVCDEEATWIVDIHHEGTRSCDAHKAFLTSEAMRKGGHAAITVVPIKAE